jgi:hypothetical protein
VIYLDGYKSMNDFIPWSDVVAKYDESKPRVKAGDYRGSFEVYGDYA